MTAAAWRLFTVEVKAIEHLSATFARITFTGADLDEHADNGADQRINFVVPLPGGGIDHMPRCQDDSDGWYAAWQRLPDDRRNPLRAYTVRAVRPQLRELDIDFVRHADAGPASQWVERAGPGDVAGILGPDRRFPGQHGGVEWSPPAGTRRLLVAGDETALPAITRICAELPATAVGHVLLEVPALEDEMGVTAPPGVEVIWLFRDGAEHGSQLVDRVLAIATDTLTGGSETIATGDGAAVGAADDICDGDPDWQIPSEPAAEARTGLYAWFAGESSTIRHLRRHLVEELGVDRRSVAFMGYWKRGRTIA